MDSYTRAKMLREHNDIDEAAEAAKLPEQREREAASLAAIVERQRKEDHAYAAERDARIAVHGRWTPWLMDDWRYKA